MGEVVRRRDRGVAARNPCVSWMGGVYGDCWYCHHRNGEFVIRPLLRAATVDGSNAKYVLVRTDFTCPLPVGLDDVHVAPLLCAGILDFCDQNHSIA